MYYSRKFALEGFTKAIAKEVKPEWNIHFLILSPGGISTEFTSNVNYTPRHPAYADGNGSPVDALVDLMKNPDAQKGWAIPEVCAEVVFDTVVGQNERPLPKRLNLGQDALPMITSEINEYLKEIEDWKEETLKVVPGAKDG